MILTILFLQRLQHNLAQILRADARRLIAKDIRNLSRQSERTFNAIHCINLPKSVVLNIQFIIFPVDFFSIKTAVNSFHWIVTEQQREELTVTIME